MLVVSIKIGTAYLLIYFIMFINNYFIIFMLIIFFSLMRHLYLLLDLHKVTLEYRSDAANFSKKSRILKST